jgi:hypothetical protein
MKKLLVLTELLLPLLFTIATKTYSQVAGDFQSKNTIGNWSDYNSWNVFNGSGWIAATSGQIPNATANVFVQAADTISIDNANATCNDLYVNGASTSKISFPTTVGILNIKGNMILATTSHNCFGTWMPGAKIIFSGTGMQGFTKLSSTSVFLNLEVNKISGSLTTSSNMRFGVFTLSAGSFIVGSGYEIQGNNSASTININGGTWSQIISTTRLYNASSGNTFPIGALTINGGNMVLATSTTNGGFQFSTINIINGGSLSLNNFSGNINIANSLGVDATSIFNTALTITPLPPSVSFNGLVNYNNAGPQTISPAAYFYLKLSGTGIKTLGTGTTYIPANGTLEMSGGGPSPTIASAGTLDVSPTDTRLIYAATTLQLAKTDEWHPNFKNISINNAAGVTMPGLSRSITGSLDLIKGILDIGTGGGLTLDGAILNRTNGYLDGTNTSDLAITGTTGGIVNMPLASHISLRNITLSGTRILIMDGTHNISLNGLFNIGASATFDNGGESQLTNSGGSIVITGKFINRDKDNFSGTNGAITTINPVLNPGCTVEYALGSDQLVTARPDYQNITFSGSGIKTLSNAFAPMKTVYITGNAIVKADHIFGDNGMAPYTDLTMDGGRLLLNAVSTQPCITGNYNCTGGTIEFANSQLTAQTIRSKSYQNIEVTGTNVRNSDGNITLNPNGIFTVKTGGIFEINDNNISGIGGTQKVLVESGAIFRSGNNEGFNGFSPALFNNSSIHKNITNIILSTGSTVEYTRNGDQPITNANGLIYQGLSIAGSGNKTAPPGLLTVQGNLAKSGAAVFLHNDGSVWLNGNNAQNFAGLTYNNLILANNTKSTAGNCTIMDSIKISNGTTLSIAAADAITLYSGPTKTARVGMVDGDINYNTTGKFVVERYIPAKKAWRFLSVATNSTQSVRSAWQEGATGSAADPAPGFGTQITSDRVSWLSDGFDLRSFSPSLKIHDPLLNSYVGISSTNNPLRATAGGYMVFVRGNRLATSVSSPPSATVLRSSGMLFTGSQPPIMLKSGSFTAINNPYASALDLRNLSKSYSVFYYVFDPNRGGNYGFGAFQTLAWNGTDYEVIPGNSGSYAYLNNIIESGQAFFAATLGADTSLSINEKTKSAAPANPVLPFTPQTLPGAHLRTNLYVIEGNGNVVLADGIMHHFGDVFDNAVDGMDAKKLFNSGENLSVATNGELLVLERRSFFGINDTMFLNLSGTTPKQYRFEFKPGNLGQASVAAWLKDNYTNTKTPVSLGEITAIDFTINEEPASAARDRFSVLFLQPNTTLPISVSNVKAYPKNEGITLEWKAGNEEGIKQYEVEHSTNGFAFKYLYAQPVRNAPGFQYKWNHIAPAAGYNYYRILIIGHAGKIGYSKVVKVLLEKNKQGIFIYTASRAGGGIHLRLEGQPQGKYTLRIFNTLGQVVALKQFDHEGGSNTIPVSPGNDLAHGWYRLEVIKPGGAKDYRVFTN